MNMYDTCTSTDYFSVSVLKQCFDKGYKLASLQHVDVMQNETVPKEWKMHHLNDNTILFFPHRFIARTYKKACARFSGMPRDIIDGFFMGRCLFDIAQSVFYKQSQDLRTIFEYIFEISTYLYNRIQLHSQYFDMNSTVVRNIRLGTLFHGYCTSERENINTWSSETIFSRDSRTRS